MAKIRPSTQLAQNGAATGDVLAWDGQWTPTDLNGTYRQRSHERIYYPEDYGAVADGVTDDTAAIQACIDAAYAAGGGTVQFADATYLVSSAPRHDRGGHAIVALPNQSNYSVGGAPLVLRGVLPMQNFNPADSRGTIISTSRTDGAYSASYGEPSIVGGPTREQVGTAFSYMTVYVENLAVHAPTNSTYAGLDLGKMCRASVDGLNVMSGPGASDFDQPTHTHAFGLRMPTVQNYNLSRVGSAMAAGWYVGYVANTEHFTVLDATAKWCWIGYAPTSLAGQGGIGANAGHATSITKLSVEACKYVIGGWDNTGLITLAEDCFLRITLLDIEDDPGANWYSRGTGVAIYDPSNHLRGVIDYNWYSSTIQTIPLPRNGGNKAIWRNIVVPSAGLAVLRQSVSRTAGNVSLTTNTSYADVDGSGGLDLGIYASAGDTVKITLAAILSGRASGANADNVNFTAYTMPSGVATNNIAGAGTAAVTAWFSPDQLWTVAGSVLYTVVAGDLNTDGSVHFRLRYRVDDGAETRTLFANAGNPLIWYAENLGQ